MGGSNKSIRVGFIAEENSDIEVMYQLMTKLIAENRFCVSQFIGHGCGKIQKKGRGWAEILIQKGCQAIVLLHDLDRRDENELRSMLNGLIDGIAKPPILILIPIEEIEAWLLSDVDAIRDVFRMKANPKLPTQPERIKDPKGWLAKLVRKGGTGKYLNTVHNKRIAAAMSLKEVQKKCPSFHPFPPFIKAIFG